MPNDQLDVASPVFASSSDKLSPSTPAPDEAARLERLRAGCVSVVDAIADVLASGYERLVPGEPTGTTYRSELAQRLGLLRYDTESLTRCGDVDEIDVILAWLTQISRGGQSKRRPAS